MDQRDWELLDKQLSGVSLTPPRNNGTIGLAFVAVFLIGNLVGGILFARDSNHAQTLVSFLNGAPSTTGQN